MTDPLDWQGRAERLADELADRKDLTHGGRAHTAIASTPRHLFVPAYYEQQPSAVQTEWARRTQADGDAWLDPIYSNRTLVTTLDPATMNATNKGRVTGVPTSSNTAPSVTARMLQSLHVEPGLSVLDLGTGTGYVTALLAHLTEDAKTITSVDIDPDLSKTARNTLQGIGLCPFLTTGDGSTITWPRRFDRVLVTYGLPAVTRTLYDAVAPFGRLVANVFGPLSVGLVALERTVTGVLEGRFHEDGVSFMAARTDPVSYPRALVLEQPDTGKHPAEVPLNVLDGRRFHFLLSAFLPGITLQYGIDDETGCPYRVLVLDGKSVTIHYPSGEKPYATGDGSTAAAVGSAYESYRSLGDFAWEDFGLTVTPQEHRLWYRKPDHLVTAFPTPGHV